jgi:GrpB-like predicted nucleotidyltransferase (UPF0157 family)
VIKVTDYDETWPVRAAAAAAELVPLGVFGAIEHIGSTSVPGRLYYYRDEDGPQACHLHVVPADTFGTRNEQLLRDHLRAHPEDARRYTKLKQQLAAEHTDGTEYLRAKTGLIQELTDRARADRGLPSVPVWEE